MSKKHYVLEAGPSSCEKHSQEPGASTSNHTSAAKMSASPFSEAANGPLRKTGLEQIEERLRALEEDNEMLKGAFMESMGERAKLIAEINDRFNSLAQRDPKSGALFDRWSKEKRVGLLQILCQESNPSIVKRGLRAKTFLG